MMQYKRKLPCGFNLRGTVFYVRFYAFFVFCTSVATRQALA